MQRIESNNETDIYDILTKQKKKKTFDAGF